MCGIIVWGFLRPNTSGNRERFTMKFDKRARVGLARVGVHALVAAVGFGFAGPAGAVVGLSAMLLSQGIAQGIAPKPAHAAGYRGDLKIFYGWKCDTVGAGNGEQGKVGGFFLDVAIAPSSYPNPEARITSVLEAVSECLSEIRAEQKHGNDAGGTIWYQIFGSEAQEPVRAQQSSDPGVGQAVRLMRVDLPERDVIRAMNMANRHKSDRDNTTLDFQQPQETGSGA